MFCSIKYDKLKYCILFLRSDVVVGRKGIGYDGSGNADAFAQLIRRYLQNYRNSASVHNIVFSNEFSNEERKLIHE
jgi:hypothetical protein